MGQVTLKKSIMVEKWKQYCKTRKASISDDMSADALRRSAVNRMVCARDQHRRLLLGQRSLPACSILCRSCRPNVLLPVVQVSSTRCCFLQDPRFSRLGWWRGKTLLKQPILHQKHSVITNNIFSSKWSFATQTNTVITKNFISPKLCVITEFT